MISVSSEKLNKMVKQAQGALAKRQVIQEVKMVRLTALDNVLTVSGTDGSFLIQAKAECETNQDALDILADPEDLLVLTKYHDGYAQLTVDKTSLLVSAFGKAKIQTANTQYFPRFEFADEKIHVPINSVDIMMLGISCGKESQLERDNCIHIVPSDGKTYLTTTYSGWWMTSIAIDGEVPFKTAMRWEYVNNAFSANVNQQLSISPRLVETEGAGIRSVFPTTGIEPIPSMFVWSQPELYRMEITAELRRAAEIAKALTGVENAIRLRANGSTLYISTFNGKEFEAEVGRVNGAAFEICVNSAIFVNYLKSVPDNALLQLTSYGGREFVRIVSGNVVHFIVPMVIHKQTEETNESAN